MKAHYMTCARSSSVDAKTNQISLFHVLDELNAVAFPTSVASLCVASLFEREAGEAAVQPYVMTISVDDVLLASFSMQVDFGSGRRNRVVNTVEGLAIPAPGRIQIRLLQKTTLLAEWTLQAIETRPAQSPRPARAPARKPAFTGTPKATPTVN